jgi:hypothetical protein
MRSMDRLATIRASSTAALNFGAVKHFAAHSRVRSSSPPAETLNFGAVKLGSCFRA